MSCPCLQTAYLDADHVVVAELSAPLARLADTLTSITVVDEEGRRYFVANVESNTQEWPSAHLRLSFTQSLPWHDRRLSLRIEGCEGVLPLVPRHVMLHRGSYSEADLTLGAACQDFETIFRVFAPKAGRAFVALYDSWKGEAGRTEIELQPRPQGIWEARIERDLHGKYYMWRFEGPHHESTRELIDPYARCASGLDGRGIVANLKRTDPDGFREVPRPPQATNNAVIVYETSVRDFTMHPDAGIKHPGKFLGLAERGTHLKGEPDISTGLDHIADLGITHLQLLPVHDFENDEEGTGYRWGYMTVNFNSPDGWFATNARDLSRITELKQLVQACHEAGIRVILDVVYNHTDMAASFEGIAPGYYHRMNQDGSFSNGSGCGNEFRSESTMGRKFIVDSCRYWVEEYQVDGFRFDLMALVDRDTILAVERECQAIDPTILVWGEPWAAGPNLCPQPANHYHLQGTGVASFNDEIRNLIKGEPRGSQAGFVQHGGGAEALAEQISAGIHGRYETPEEPLHYVEAHDDNTLWDKLAISTGNATDEERRRMQMMAGAILLTSFGKVFLHGGQEMCRTKQGHPNTYNMPDEINQIDYSWKKAYPEVLEYHRGLIKLRREHTIFAVTSREEVEQRLKFIWERPTSKSLHYIIDCSNFEGTPWEQICVIHNADSKAHQFTLPDDCWSISVLNGQVDLNKPLGKGCSIIDVDARRSAILYKAEK